MNAASSTAQPSPRPKQPQPLPDDDHSRDRRHHGEATAFTAEAAAQAHRFLDELMAGLAGCFARVEPRRQARKYIYGLVSDLPHKNCWTLAEHAGDATPDKMQRLLERAVWDACAAIRAVRAFAVARPGDPRGAVLVLDESGQEKAGEQTAGVKRQYLGCAGRVANGINVVYASYAAPAGHAIIEARLYVPKDWADNRERCQAAGIPDDLEFKTKPQLAAEIVTNFSPKDAARRGSPAMKSTAATPSCGRSWTTNAPGMC